MNIVIHFCFLMHPTHLKGRLQLYFQLLNLFAAVRFIAFTTHALFINLNK